MQLSLWHGADAPPAPPPSRAPLARSPRDPHPSTLPHAPHAGDDLAARAEHYVQAAHAERTRKAYRAIGAPSNRGARAPASRRDPRRTRRSRSTSPTSPSRPPTEHHSAPSAWPTATRPAAAGPACPHPRARARHRSRARRARRGGAAARRRTRPNRAHAGSPARRARRDRALLLVGFAGALCRPHLCRSLPLLRFRWWSAWRLELQRGEHGWISAEGGCSTTFDPSEGAEPDGSLRVKAATNCTQALDYVGDASSAVTIASVSFAVTL